MNSGVYAIRHTKTGRCYIGSSVQFNKRWYQHRVLLVRGAHHAGHLQHAWTKYGPDAFTFRVLEECAPDKALLLAREQHYIDTLRPVFNYAKKAGSRLGVPVSEKSKAQISAAMMGRPKPWLAKTHCKNGHALTPESTYLPPKGGARQCRACKDERSKKAYGPLKGRFKSICRRGHPRTPESTTILANGGRTCRICLNATALALYHQKRAALNIPPHVRRQPVIWPRGTHCQRGHERTPENTHARSDGHGECRICRNARERGAYAAGLRT